MLFNNDLKDNLIVARRDAGRRRRRVILLALLFIAVVAVAFVFEHPLRDYLRQAQPQEPVARVRPKPAPVDPGKQIMPQMRAFIADRALIQAREKGYEILAQSKDPSVIEETENLLGQINMELILMPLPMPEKEKYIVKSGDSLERIAKMFGTTVELVRKGNALSRNIIHPGDCLRVFKGTFSIDISKSRNDLVLNVNDRFCKRYRVGTGKHGTTPTGNFVISDKIVEPPWWRPDGKVLPFGDQENVLGTRWMSLTAVEGTADVKGYGIHGTWEPDTVGRQASEGCVRLLNSDVEELFMLVPIGASAAISE